MQSSLLRECEKTGRRTLSENLVRSAVSGKLFSSDIASKCEESGANALPEELVRCDITGKRVLPDLLGQCEVSGRRVFRNLLRQCEFTGKMVLPEFLIHCRRSGKYILSSSATKSEVSGELGHPDLITSCDLSGRKAFPDELVLSQISGKNIAKDRSIHCPACDRLADISELKRCSICRQQYCHDDFIGITCRICGELISGRNGRDLTNAEIGLLRRKRPWIRRGRAVESPGLIHIELISGRLNFVRHPELIILKKNPSMTFSNAVDTLLAGCVLDRHIISKIQKSWNSSSSER